MPRNEEENGRQILYASVGIVILMMTGFMLYTALRTRNNPMPPVADNPIPDGSWSDLNNGGDGGSSPGSNEDDRYNQEYQQEVALRQPEERLQLSCDDVAVYSGPFVEDGSDEPVENIASILLTNRSGKYLTFARLTYQLDGETAIFEVTDLPAGKSVWILEKNRRKATDSSKYVYQESQTSFSDNMTLMPGELKVEYAENLLRITNVSELTIDHAIVYYKSLYKDQRYLGGITYKLAFGTLRPGDSVEKIADHYDRDTSVILRIVHEESTDQ